MGFARYDDVYIVKGIYHSSTTHEKKNFPRSATILNRPKKQHKFRRKLGGNLVDFGAKKKAK